MQWPDGYASHLRRCVDISRAHRVPVLLALRIGIVALHLPVLANATVAVENQKNRVTRGVLAVRILGQRVGVHAELTPTCVGGRVANLDLY